MALDTSPGLGAAAPLLGPLAALCSSLTWAYGSTVYAARARESGAVEVNLARTLLVLPLFLGAALLGGSVTAESLAVLRQPGRLLWLFLSTVCSYGLGDLCFYLAAARLPTATALAIASTYPVWAALAAAWTLGEPLHAGRLLGILCCGVGVSWLVLQRPGAGPREGAGPPAGSPWGGVVLALLTSAFWAGNTYSVRRGAGALPGFLVNSARYSFALLILLPLWLRQRRARPAGPRLLQVGRPLLRFAVPSFIEAFVGSSLFVYGLSHCDLSVAAPLSSLAPLFAVPVGLMLRTETLELRRLCAITLTVIGVVLLVR